MSRIAWVGPSGRTRVMYLCVAFLGAMVFVDGLMQGEFLRPFAGGIVAACFGTFLFRGFPLPAQWVRRAERDMDKILSLRAGATSPFFRWAMVVLGAAIGFGALLLAAMMLAGSLEASLRNCRWRCTSHGMETASVNQAASHWLRRPA